MVKGVVLVVMEDCEDVVQGTGITEGVGESSSSSSESNAVISAAALF